MRNNDYSSPWEGLLPALLITVAVVLLIVGAFFWWFTSGDSIS